MKSIYAKKIKSQQEMLKMSLKKNLISFAVLLTLSPAFTLLGTSSQIAFAQEKEKETETIQIKDRSAAVVIFFGGIVVGWVIDGTIKYATGHAPSEWVSIGLGKVESYIKSQAAAGVTNITVNTSAFSCPGVPIDHSGMCN